MGENKIPQEARKALDISLRELSKYENKINVAHGVDHTKRDFNLCKEILKYHIEADSVVVLVAAAFHDIGRIRNEGKHEVWSGEITRKHLDENEEFEKIDGTKKKLILDIIKNHSALENEVSSEIREKIEFKILVDADRIDSFGPIGIIRASLDERYQKSAKDQLKHIKDKYNPDNYKLASMGGQEIGNKYKTYLCNFEKTYKEQENIGN